MPGIEDARRQVAEYEQGTATARARLAEFNSANGGRLDAIRDEFEDYTNHPLWAEYRELRDDTTQHAGPYMDWHGEHADSLGWEEAVLFYGDGYSYLSADKPDRSKLPLTVEEFDRRAAIAGHIGEVAAMLHDHQGEPVVSVAVYEGSLAFDPQKNPKLRGHGFQAGRIDGLPKLRTIVGTIDQPTAEPILSTTQDEGNNEPELRITMAGNVTGLAKSFSMPDDKGVLKTDRVKMPSYVKTRELFGNKRKDLPFGKSVTGDFPISELTGRDLMVIDGPHRTSADFDFPDGIRVYRPKQKIEKDSQTRDQEVAVRRSADSSHYEARIVSGAGEVWLPARRHNTVWLIGHKAIEAHLAGVVARLAPPESLRRGSDRAMLQVARDLIDIAEYDSATQSAA